MTTKDSDMLKVQEELVAIKKLLVLALSKNGATQIEIANVLGVDNSTISLMLSKPKKVASK